MHLSQQKKYAINIVLAAIAISIIIFYTICADSCLYLKGSIFGIGLEYVGIAYMAVVIFLSIFKKDLPILMLLSAGIGVESYLVGFQIIHDTYCPYCLAFGLIIVVLFLINFDWKKRWFIVASILAGLAFFVLLFKGTTFPTYAFVKNSFKC